MHVPRPDLKHLWCRALCSCDAGRLVQQRFAGILDDTEPVHVLALGKAAGPMAAGAISLLEGRAKTSLVISSTREGAPDMAKVCVGEHPHPGPGSFAAGRELLARAEEIQRRGEKALVLVSGGGSALCEVPAPGLTENDLRAAHEALVSSGAPIETINRLRRKLSAIKGGGLARALGPSLAWEGVLVDIPSCDPDAVASGPCSREGEAGAGRFVVGTPVTLAEAAASAARESESIPVVVRSEVVSGMTVEQLGEEVLRHLSTGSGLWIASGEVSVPLPRGGPKGHGGRAQHLALWVLHAARHRLGEGRWAFLAAGSDGRDGTGGAGALVDDDIKGCDRLTREALEEHASGEAHRKYGSLIEEHPPRTNLTDLYIAWAPDD